MHQQSSSIQQWVWLRIWEDHPARHWRRQEPPRCSPAPWDQAGDLSSLQLVSLPSPPVSSPADSGVGGAAHSTVMAFATVRHRLVQAAANGSRMLSSLPDGGLEVFAHEPRSCGRSANAFPLICSGENLLGRVCEHQRQGGCSCAHPAGGAPVGGGGLAAGLQDRRGWFLRCLWAACWPPDWGLQI